MRLPVHLLSDRRSGSHTAGLTLSCPGFFYVYLFYFMLIFIFCAQINAAANRILLTDIAGAYRYLGAPGEHGEVARAEASGTLENLEARVLTQ